MKLKQLIGMLPLVLIMAASCSKDTQAPAPNPNPTPVPLAKLSKIEYEFYSIALTYNADSTIANFIHTSKTDPTQSETYFVQYAGGKLSEVNFGAGGAKWKYYYTGNLLTKIESYNENGVFKYQTELVYANGRVIEKIESLVGAMGIPREKLKTIFQYNPQGNVSKKEMWEFVNNVWGKSEDILYPEYDAHEDVTERFEDYPFLPQGLFSINNPKKEIFVDVDGTVTGTVTYTYLYDEKGRVTNKKAVHDFMQFPGFEETTKIFY